MIHVLICPHKLDFGGSQLSVHHWAKFLDRSKFKVSILAMQRGGLSDKFEACYPVYYDSDLYPNIKKYINDLKPDILHACPGGGEDLEYISIASEHVPVTQTVMCPRPVPNQSEVSGSVVLSQFNLSLQPDKRHVIQIDAPFDVSDYELKYSREHFALQENKLIIGSIGNNRRENSHFMKIARNYKNDNVHFVIKTKMKYKYLFGRKRITVINRGLSENEKLSLMNCFDIVLYPTSNESYGLVFLEAMSQKVPIVSYDDSAMPEVIGSGGLLAPLDDIKRMTELIDELVSDSEKRKTLGEAGYQLFKRRNNPKVIAKKYESFFENVLNKKTYKFRSSM